MFEKKIFFLEHSRTTLFDMVARSYMLHVAGGYPNGRGKYATFPL